MTPKSVTLVLLSAGLISTTSETFAQGCVAVRGGQCAHIPGTPGEHRTGYLEGGDWNFSLGYRWLHSDRHFRGDKEEKHRQEEGSEVVNDSHFWDLGVQYAITPRYSVGLTIPFVYSDRSSLYEHRGNPSPTNPNPPRYHTQAGGLGDVRLTAYMWVFDPEKMPKGNILVGIGPKFPTGQYDAKDTFHKPPARGGTQEWYVDQSIQPGDGGWGFTAEFYAFRELFERTMGYFQGAYLFNPETENSARNFPNTAGVSLNHSIADQYLGRIGLSYAIWPEQGLTLSFGGRVEGVPASDVFGADNGFRRPGYAVSVEPGLSWMKGPWTVNLTTPVAVYRNRVRSWFDKRTGGHGDAAFADWTVTASISYRLYLKDRSRDLT